MPEVPGWVWVIGFIRRGGLHQPPRNRGHGTDEHDLLDHSRSRSSSLFVGGALDSDHPRTGFSSALAPLLSARVLFSWELVFTRYPLSPRLAYIGFDAISTLNEEAKGGGKAVSKATMIVLWLVIAMFVAQVYFAALFVPSN